MQKKFIGRAIKKIAAVSAGVALLGATMTGALAADLASFPEPFVKDNVYDDATAFVVGDSAMAVDTQAQSYLVGLFQSLSKEQISTGGGLIETEGMESQEVVLGKNIGTEFDTPLGNRKIETLFRGDITFNGKDYEVEEEIHFGNDGGPKIVTSLTSGEDDYESDIFMHIEKKELYYAYRFRKDMGDNLNTTVTEDIRLDLDFLGHNLRIIDVEAGEIKAYVGEEHFLDQYESVVVEGHTVEVKRIGDGSAVIEVDGQTKTMTTTMGSFLFNSGLEVSIDTIFYTGRESDMPAVNLIIGEKSVETYESGDGFIGEDSDDPEWVWEIKGMDQPGASDYDANVKVLRIYNDFRKTSPRDNPAGVGECIDLPKGYISVCLDSLTVEDDELEEYYMEIDYFYFDEIDDAPDGWNSTDKQDVLLVKTSLDEGFRLQSAKLDNLASDKSVSEFWLYTEDDGTTIELVYKEDNDKIYAGEVTQSEEFAKVDYDDTRDNLGLEITDTELTWANSEDEDLVINWTTDGTFLHLGTDPDDTDSDDVKYGTTGIGTKEEDHRTVYGIVVVNPNSEGKSDRVTFMVPPEQVKANVVVKHKDAVLDRASGSWEPVTITPKLFLASEVSDASMYNLVVVGGPCANPLAEELFDVTCDGWGLDSGEALVQMADNGDKVALLVAGTLGEDTKRAGLALSQYKDHDFDGSSAIVRGTSLTDISVEGE